jgi:hypothetical protein
MKKKQKKQLKKKRVMTKNVQKKWKEMYPFLHLLSNTDNSNTLKDLFKSVTNHQMNLICECVHNALFNSFLDKNQIDFIQKYLSQYKKEIFHFTYGKMSFANRKKLCVNCFYYIKPLLQMMNPIIKEFIK